MGSTSSVYLKLAFDFFLIILGEYDKGESNGQIDGIEYE